MEHTTRERIESAILNHYEILDSKWRWFEWFMEVITSIEKEAQARWEKIGEERKRKELADFIRENRNTVTLVQIENLIDNL
jgi:hypothetical protein